jgi:hypothetical protein
MFHRQALLKGATPQLLNLPQVGNALAATFQSSQCIWLEGVVLPEFGNWQKISQQEALVFDADSACEAVLGLDFLMLTGIDACLSDQTLRWMGKVVPMKDKMFWDDPVNLFLALDPDEDDTFNPRDASDTFVTELKQARHEETSPRNVATQHQHLDEAQREQLAQVLVKCNKLFSNQLKMCPITKSSACTSHAIVLFNRVF